MSVLRLAGTICALVALVFFFQHHAVAADRDGILTFNTAEFAFSETDAPPVSGWTRRPLPQRSLEEEARAHGQRHITVWVRVRFNRSEIGAGPQALYTQDIAERYVAYLNGVDIHRTYAGKDEWTIGWNRPVLATVPAQALLPGTNELLLRVDSSLDWFLHVGQVKIGPITSLRPLYNNHFFWRIKGTEIANYIMLALTVITFLFWRIRRRQEPELKWLIAIGIVYFVRDSVFIFENAPFKPLLFGLLSQTMVFLLNPLCFGFSAEYLKVENRVGWNRFWFVTGILNALASFILVLWGFEGRICTAILLLSGVWSMAVLSRARWAGDGLSRALLLTTIAATIGAGIHDLGRQDHLLLWDGAGFFLQPYNGLAIFTAFFFLIGRRYVAALGTVESLNASLETRIADAQANLEESEQARRTLEVASALEAERERLMAEVHDGIGSSLITALAVARQENHPQQTIDLLRRAVADLKITVDSLDPLEGDVLALLGNLRHRMEPDLTRAGLSVKWDVQDCPSLVWLDPANALQFLRLIQEAVSNALSHSAASAISFECRPKFVLDRDGVEILIVDNGRGFDANALSSGRGFGTMRDRAKALGGDWSYSSQPGQGAKIRLWLPLDRRIAPRT